MQPVIEGCANAKSTVASGSDARSGTSTRPSPKHSRILSSVRAKWRGSIWRIVASELCMFPLRIRAILDRPNLTSHAPIPLAPKVDSDSFALNHSFALACSDHIRRQQALCRWSGPLDIEMLGIAFQAGAEWRSHTQSNAEGNEVDPCLYTQGEIIRQQATQQAAGAFQNIGSMP